MTTGAILKAVRQSRLDSQSAVGKITGYSRQHIAACERNDKCFAQYPSIVKYVLTVTQQNINVEEVLRSWIKEADDSDKRLRSTVRELARSIIDETL